MTWDKPDLTVMIDAQLMWPSQSENDQQLRERQEAGHKVRAMGKDLEAAVKLIVKEMIHQAGIPHDVGVIGGR